MFFGLFRKRPQAFGVFIEIFSCPIRDIVDTSLMYNRCELATGGNKNVFIKELVNDCPVRVEPLFLPLRNFESHEKGFLLTGQIGKGFEAFPLNVVSLGEFLDKWAENLKKMYGTETCGYKPNYPNPRALFLAKFLEAEKNNEGGWHEQ